MAQQSELVKGLGIYGATSVVAGTMIGTGIFVVPSIMLQQVGTPWLVLAVWIFAGALSLFGASGYAELSAAIPEAGGEYVYLSRAYGRLTGFMFGWTTFFMGKPAGHAAVATGFVLYLSYFFPGLAAVIWEGRVGLAGIESTIQLTGLQVGAALLIVFISVLNIFGVRRSGNVQTIFTASKILVLAVLVVLGLTLGHGSFDHFRQAAGPGLESGFLAAFGLATVGALHAYDGWNNLSMVAGEVEDARRNIPRALIFGMLLVVAVYMAANVAFFYVLAPAEAAGTSTVAADTARRLLGGAGGAFIAVGVMVSCFATLNGGILAGSRVPFAQARDGLFPQALAGVHPRFRTPVMALMAQALIAGLLALSGTYQALFTKGFVAQWVFYALVTGAVFILRRREPGLSRPYRTWGYPLVPAVFVLLAASLLINTFLERRADSLAGLAIIASGIPAYYVWSLWRGKKTA